MEIIRIGENKLKLILTGEDLEKHHLKLDSLDYDNTETRRVLWQILDEAKQKTGFDAASERTLVQAYPGRKSGCEIYITRLSNHTPGLKGRHSIFRFYDPTTLFSVCRTLSTGTRKYDGALYKDDQDFYYLCLKESLASSIQKEDALSPLSFVEEYAQRVKSTSFFAYIKEHGSCLLASRAVETLSDFSSF